MSADLIRRVNFSTESASKDAALESTSIPADLIVRDSGVIVLDHRSRKLLFYDHPGAHQKTVSLEYIVFEITEIQDSNLIFAVAGDNRHRKEAKGYETIILDTEGHFVSAALPNKYPMNYTSSFKSFLYGGKIVYSRPLFPIVYDIDQNGVSEKYRINIQDSPLPADYEKSSRGDFDRFVQKYRGRYNYFIGSLLENNDMVFFITENKERRRFWNVYEKASGKVHTGLISLSKIKPLLVEGMILRGLTNSLGCYEDRVVGYLNAIDLSVESFSLDYPILTHVKENDNPVIFRYKFK